MLQHESYKSVFHGDAKSLDHEDGIARHCDVTQKAAAGLPGHFNDPHFNRNGQRAYLDSVVFLPVKKIKGWQPSNGDGPEHMDATPALLMMARDCSWAEFGIPPVILNAKYEYTDGNHRVNSARLCGDETLIPVLFSEQERVNPSEWQAPGIKPVHAVVETVTHPEDCSYMTVTRRPEWLGKPLGELMQSIQEARIFSERTYQLSAISATPRNLLTQGGRKDFDFEFELATDDVLKDEQTSRYVHLHVKDADLTSGSWSELVASGTVNEMDGVRALSKTVSELIAKPCLCDELRLHINWRR